ncbi:MAG: 30S ribosomal protein S4e [Methanomassiliicoccales archaeon]
MSKNMKRLTAPRSWPIARKTAYWATKPAPGPHPIERSIPVSMVIRDMLHLCDTANEAKYVVGKKEVLVDGRPPKSSRFPVGLMDVVSIPKLDQHSRMLLDHRGKFRLVDIGGGQEKWKLCRIESKTTLKGGVTQLNLHDGRNLTTEQDSHSTGDVLKIGVPIQEVMGTFKLTEGNTAMVISGAHAGEVAVIKEVEITRSHLQNVVRFQDGTSTVKANVFVIGTKTPEIELPEASVV